MKMIAAGCIGGVMSVPMGTAVKMRAHQLKDQSMTNKQ
jgi:hypothetical protein